MGNLTLFTYSLILLSGISSIFAIQLRTNGSNFYYGNDKVFLSGANFAWNSYGYDFGDGNYVQNSKAVFEDWVDRIRANGGNVARVWVHIEGDSTPVWNPAGIPISPDRTGTFINDLNSLLDYAYEKEVFIILCLWNGAVLRNENYKNMTLSDEKTQAYIGNVLIPVVRELKNKPALAAWEIFNEPEGLISIEPHENPCFNTTRLINSGAGWAGAEIPMYRLLRFINWLTDAIKTEDPLALVTTGTSPITNTDNFGYVNHFKDSCLLDAGGRANGTIDFYQLHSYTWQGSWTHASPFTVERSEYNNSEKPLIVGEFAEACSQGEGIEGLYNYTYAKGYNGALVWQYFYPGECADSHEVKEQGMRFLRDRNDQGAAIGGGLVNVDIRY